MNADKFFGKELADEIRKTLAYAQELNQEEKQTLANIIREQSEKNESSTVVKEVLNRLADLIAKKTDYAGKQLVSTKIYC